MSSAPVHARAVWLVVVTAMLAAVCLPAHAANPITLATSVTLSSGSSEPFGITVDSKGDIFFTDATLNTVNELVAVNGSVPVGSTFKVISSQANGVWFEPAGVVMDSAGDLLVTDYVNNAVKEIVAVGGAIPASPTVLTLVSSGCSNPVGEALDSQGDLFVTCSASGAVLEIMAVSGSIPSSPTVKTVATVAGNNYGLAVDSSGDVYLGGFSNGNISEIVAVSGVIPASPTVKTVASSIGNIFGLSIDSSGDLFVIGNPFGIKELVAVGGVIPSSPTIQTISTAGSVPAAVTLDSKGNVYWTDAGTGTVNEIGVSSPAFGSVAVGTTSASQTLTFNVAAGTTIGSIGYLTQGASNLDFKALSPDTSSTLCTAKTYSTAATCTLDIVFAPTAPGVRLGAIAFYDSATPTPNILGSVAISGTGVGPQVAFGATSIYSIGSKPNLGQTNGAAVDGAGDVYAIDWATRYIYEYVAQNGVVPPSPTVRKFGTGADALASGVVDGAGDLFIGDASADTIYEYVAINGTLPATPTVKQIATGYSNSLPTDLKLDANQNLWDVDYGANKLLEFTAASGYATVISIPTTGITGNLWAMAFSPAGDIYIDNIQGSVYKIAAVNGVIPASPTITQLNITLVRPTGMATDVAGDLFVADYGANTIYEYPAVGGVLPATPTRAVIGSGWDLPYQLTFAGNGNLYVGDSSNARVAEVFLTGSPTLSFQSTNIGSTSTDSPQYATMTNTGNATLSFPIPTGTSTNPTISGSPAASFSVVNSSTCPQETSSTSTVPTLAVGSSCTYGVSFKPTATSNAAEVIISDSLGTQAITVTGTGIQTPGPDMTITSTHTGNFSQGQVGATYTLTVANMGTTASSGTITVTDTVPTGMTVTAMSGSGWTCTTLPTCTMTTALAASGTSTITVTVTVATNAGTPLVNSVVVSGGGDINTSNNTGTDSTIVNQSTFVVDSTSDAVTTGTVANCTAGHTPGTCTLRSAVAAVNTFTNGTATINFDPTVFATAQTITLGSGGTLSLTGGGETVNINGPGQTLLTVSGANTYEILSQANGAAALSISNITLSNGKTGGSGGAVNAAYTALTLTNVTMSNNVAGTEGAFNSASAVVTGSTFTNNSTTGSDGAFYANSLTMTNSTFTGNTSGGQAGVGYARDSYTLTNCVFTNNKAKGTSGGTLITNTGGFTITGSTFTGNSAATFGGAIYMGASGSLSIQNSTFNGNSATQGGAIYANNVTMSNTTVTGNTTTSGAAVYLDGGNALFNNTIYGNTGGGLQTTSAPGGTDNIVAASTGTNCLGSGCPTDPSNILSGSGFLMPLGTYGATTLQTMPAIIGGAAYRVESSSYYSTDEIGGTRPTSGANSSDAGAVQSAVTAAWTTQPPASTVVNTNFTAAVTLKEFGNAISLSGPATVSIPVTLTGNGTLTGSPLTSMSASGVVTGTFSVNAIGTGDTLTVNGVASNSFNITAPPQIAPTVATVSAISSIYGTTTGITVTATESGTNGVATGDVVTFAMAGGLGGTFSPATCSITSAGTCTTTYTPSSSPYLPVGTYANDVTASFAAGANYLAASAANTVTITTATPTLGTVTFSPAATEVYATSQAITLSDTLTYPTGAALPTGAVTFVLNGITYTATCTAANPSTCSATVPAATIAALAVNSYTVTAALAAAGNYIAATGTSATFSITAGTPTLGTVTFSPAASEPYGTSAAITVSDTLTYTGSAPTGAVTFVLNGVTYTATCGTTSPATCSATVPAATIAVLPVAGYSVTAAIAAAGNYKAATGTSATFTITATTPVFGTMTFSPAATEPFGTSQIITISDPLTYTGALPTGAVKFTLNAVSYTATCTGASPATCSAPVPAATIAALPVNSYTVTAALTAAGNYAAATGTSGTFTITAIAPTVSTVSAVSAPFGSVAAVTVTATESGTGGVVTGGVVTFGLTGTATGSFSAPTCTLVAAGTCTVTYTPTGTLPAGAYTNDITASFAAVGNYAAANATSTLTITTIAPTVATITPIVAPFGSTAGVTITATESGTTGGPSTGGIVTFGVTGTATGTFNPATCTLGTTGTCTTNYIPTGTLATGPYPGDITATFATVGNYSAATATTSLQILLATPAVSLTSSVNPALLQSPVVFTATVTPPAGSLFAGDSVTFYDNTTQTALASVALTAGVAKYTTSSLTVGTHSITAIFPGDAGFSPVTSSAVAEVIEDFTFVISPAAGSSTVATVPPGGEASYTFSLSMSNGLNFPAGVAITATGAPAGSIVTLSPSSIASGSGPVSVVLTVQVPAATGALHHDDHFGRGLTPVALALLLLPFSSRLRKRVKRLGKVVTLGIFLLAGAALTSALTGCGYNTGFFNTYPGTYTITVTGTSGTLSHSSTVTLNVE